METYLLLSRQASSQHQVQTWALLYWEFHYAKRIFETFFVHRCELSTAALPQTKLHQSQPSPTACAYISCCGKQEELCFSIALTFLLYLMSALYNPV